VVPDDGAWWIERNGSLVADRLEPNGPASALGAPRRCFSQHQRRAVDTAGGYAADLLFWRLVEALFADTSEGTLDVEVVLVPAERSMNDWLRLIALTYLSIGYMC